MLCLQHVTLAGFALSRDYQAPHNTTQASLGYYTAGHFSTYLRIIIISDVDTYGQQGRNKRDSTILILY